MRGTAAGAVLCVVAALPGGTAVASGAAGGFPGGPGDPGGYAFAEDARSVTGAPATSDAPLLKPGETYRSSLSGRAKLYFRLELDAATTAYVPVTAVPPAGAGVSANDGIKVSVQDANGGTCGSYASARIGAGLSPRPLTALGTREAGRVLCREAGTYYVLVERLDATGAGAAGAFTSGTWKLELAPASEPPVAKGGATSAPEVWNSASPEALSGERRRRDGGPGFATARALEQGVWQTGLTPGQTLFYTVPVDWGQQLYATAELGSAGGGATSGTGASASRGSVGEALDVSLYNPVRGYVDDVALSYDGSQKSAALPPLPPVEYHNRYGVLDRVRNMRFGGWYFLVVHLSEQVAGTFGREPLGLTLRVRVSGTPHAGPGYDGQPKGPQGTRLFEVTAQDRIAAATGDDTGSGDSSAMRALAVGGIGTGSALLLVLGVWTVAARRRAGAQMRVSAQTPTA
ncbi:hypothetical protein [Streptomyces sp. V3I7]|uniref:hypothetical protein n=1 Tax=Streptomyces sp. V3I7 TaxID=3042278 RepID=UPI0027D860AE|nr:hypothetical protein [Streptomyces sp. V3I7]